MHSLVISPLKKDRYSKKILGAIGKMESEDDVVWIIIQARQLKCKKGTIPKIKEDGKDLIFIFYANPNHKEKFFKLVIGQDKKKTTTSVPIVVMLHTILGPMFCNEEKRRGSCAEF